MYVYLRLVRPYFALDQAKFNSNIVEDTSTHDPVPIVADSNTLASLLKLEVLEELHTTGIIWVIFEAALPLSCKPFR